MQTCCPIVELRQYTLHPGKRDVLIDLFDREFIEPQEALGMNILGQFCDLDDPDRFVCLRGFQDMASRAAALQAFYGGPVWKAHRETANASGFALETSDRSPRGSKEIPGGIVIGTIYYFDAPVNSAFIDFFERVMKPVLAETGAAILASFVTENSENTFPALPVREGENVVIWFARFSNQADYDRYLATLTQSPNWRDEVLNELTIHRNIAQEVLRLSPTARSQLR
ncbi:MAG: hypothetical protein DME75_10540 [Verrucomicrobia bacterium]|nr:MAG: hypothetical protein DME75_10540 [Verrucomicrobiota bacterium]